ncbi:peptide deformylase [uncultured Gammaproteobacteria bacterium]
MALLPLLFAPDPRLKRKATPVTVVDARVVKLIDDMLETMYHFKGIGLAAPQVDVLERVVVVDIADKDSPPEPMALVNPEVVWVSEDTVPYNEGCLSLPDQFADVDRPRAVRVRYLDRTGQELELVAEGVLAVCVQHEIDHLDGVLFVDYISAIRRGIILRRLQKMKKSGTLD